MVQHIHAKKSSGFTLIELVIAVAIIGIIAAIAIPAYQSQIRKARRSEALDQLLNITLSQEKFRANNPQYAISVVDLCDWLDDGDNANASCATATLYDTDHYAITLLGAGNIYTITATATGDQLNDSCLGGGTMMTIDESSTKLPADCW